MRSLVLSFFLLHVLLAFGQDGRQFRTLYEVDREFRPSGWHFAPGVVGMFPSAYRRDANRATTSETGIQTLYNGSFEARGGGGLYLELGKQHFLRRSWLIDYLDFGLHLKQFRGRERFEGMVLREQGMAAHSYEAWFNEGYVGLYFNANHIAQVADRSFLQFSLGVNADYRVWSSNSVDRLDPIMEPIFPENFFGQLHAKVGFGWRPEPGIFIIPSVETPILTVYPGDDGKSSMPYYHSRYRPLIFSLRFLFFARTRVADCVGTSTEKRGHELWGEDMRKSGKKKRKKKKRPRN